MNGHFYSFGVNEHGFTQGDKSMKTDLAYIHVLVVGRLRFFLPTGAYNICVCFTKASRKVYKKLTSPTMVNARLARDIKTRHGVMLNEVARRAYLFVARNQNLPPQVRHQAQFQLNNFGRYTRPTAVKNRCHESGRGRGVMSEFALTRVCGSIFISFSFTFTLPISQFQFRLKALKGEIPGVRKASW